MNKRRFLNLMTGALASPIIAPLTAFVEGQPLKNWAGNLTYSTRQVDDATTVDQVRSIVRAQEKLKALGTRHCFNAIADSSHHLLSMKPMHAIVALDAAARTVTVEPGVTYGQLGPYLDAKGFALHNLASLPHISVAGSCTTATHGSGEKNRNLSSAVSGLEIVTASGDLVKLSRKTDGEAFRGAVVGLGALGVITRVTLDIEPTYKVRQYVYLDLPLEQVKEHFDQIQASGYSVSLFTDWQRRLISELWIKVRDDSAFAGPPEFHGAKLATRDVHPIENLSAENCTAQQGVPGPWYDRLPHFRMGFTPSAGQELQSEYLLPRRNAVDAILSVERLRDQITPHLLISEIRTIAADDLWMSTCYKQDSVAIHFTWKPDWPAVKRVLPVIEKELSAYRARPHWGKLFTMEPRELRARYEKLDDFVQLATKYDPRGKFRNQFLDSTVFAS